VPLHPQFTSRGSYLSNAKRKFATRCKLDAVRCGQHRAFAFDWPFELVGTAWVVSRPWSLWLKPQEKRFATIRQSRTALDVVTTTIVSMKLFVAAEKMDARAALDLARLRSDPVLLLLSRTGSTPFARVTQKVATGTKR
jgi:hypothetical protein